MVRSDRSNRKALILGSTGLVGSCLLEILLKSELYQEVTAVVRKPIPLKGAGLTIKVVDFNHLEEAVDGLEVDDIYCCLGTTMKQAGSKQAFRQVDYEYPVQVARVLRKNARHFLVVSALGANPHSRIFYNRIKGEMEQALVDCNYSHLTVARPSLLLGERTTSRFLESVGIKMVKLIKPALCGPFKRYAGIEARDVATALFNQAKDVASQQRQQKNLILESDMMQPG